MDSEKVKNYIDEAKTKLNFIIKNEIKRKFIGETYSYLIKIPEIAFWLVAIVSLFAVLMIELIVAGIVWPNEVIHYKELLMGFGIAAFLGLINGNFYRRKLSKKIHAQIGDTLKYKSSKKNASKDKKIND